MAVWVCSLIPASLRSIGVLIVTQTRVIVSTISVTLSLARDDLSVPLWVVISIVLVFWGSVFVLWRWLDYKGIIVDVYIRSCVNFQNCTLAAVSWVCSYPISGHYIGDISASVLTVITWHPVHELVDVFDILDICFTIYRLSWGCIMHESLSAIGSLNLLCQWLIVLLRTTPMRSIELLSCILWKIYFLPNFEHFACRMGLFQWDLTIKRIIWIHLLATFLALGHGTSINWPCVPVTFHAFDLDKRTCFWGPMGWKLAICSRNVL